jgi:hypothetical protein
MQFRAARSAADGHAHFVYVHDDGSARELTANEAEYLATPFDPTDGGRPYIKAHYNTRTPTGSLRGFLERSELPGHIRLQPADA